MFAFQISATSLSDAAVSMPYGPVTLLAAGQVSGATLIWKKVSAAERLQVEPRQHLVTDPLTSCSQPDLHGVRPSVGKVRMSQTVSTSLNLFFS